MYTPTFAISIISTVTGNGIIDCGTSDLKTPKGAAKNWMTNCGHILGSFLASETVYHGEGYRGSTGLNPIKIAMRPIETKEDAINISVSRIRAQSYIEREERHGATAYDLSEVS